ncbi:MAG TPA: phosphoglycerate kinase [Victivallales bacterium]|nr:phosphoglycerate kinase [Victivallales bacterium]
MGDLKITPMSELDFNNKKVLLRLDINSPIDADKKIVNENRIKKSLPTLEYLIKQNAKIAIIAHQGDTLDYQNLIPLKEHAEKLTGLLGREVTYIDDVCGPAALEAVNNLKSGELIILGNVRYLCEEISTFENVVKLNADEMLDTFIVRSLAPIFDVYVNDAFAAAHRNCPSMVAFQEILPSAAGELMFKEVSALSKVMTSPAKPLVFVLGGAKISDAFGMMKQVLENDSADKILTTGVTGEIFLLAKGISIGETKMKFIKDRSLEEFIKPAKEYLEKYSDKIEIPSDLAFEKNGVRDEINIDNLPADEMFMDIGSDTIARYEREIEKAGTIFVNGPAGVYENELFAKGTDKLWQSIAKAEGYSVIGGGDTVSAAAKFVDLENIDYVCTAGGAMVRFLSGKKLPLIEAMEKAYSNYKK